MFLAVLGFWAYMAGRGESALSGNGGGGGLLKPLTDTAGSMASLLKWAVIGFVAYKAWHVWKEDVREEDY